jgi:hypothetical protein
MPTDNIQKILMKSQVVSQLGVKSRSQQLSLPGSDGGIIG